MIVGEIHREGQRLEKFPAIGQPGYEPGISDLVRKYQ